MADARRDFYGDSTLKLKHDPDPGPLRAAAYPSEGDQLDALWKIVQALLSKEPPPTEALAVCSQVLAVKNKYQKRTPK